jgi:hypothetical protein
MIRKSSEIPHLARRLCDSSRSLRQTLHQESGPVLVRFHTDFGPVLDRFWSGFIPIFPSHPDGRKLESVHFEPLAEIATPGATENFLRRSDLVGNDPLSVTQVEQERVTRPLGHLFLVQPIAPHGTAWQFPGAAANKFALSDCAAPPRTTDNRKAKEGATVVQNHAMFDGTTLLLTR